MLWQLIMYKKNIKMNVKLNAKNNFTLVSDTDVIYCIKKNKE